MSDPYRLPGASDAPSDPILRRSPAAEQPAAAERAHRDGQRAVLWALLVLTAVANSVTSAMAVPMGISLALGALSLACVTALVVSHVRQGRS